MATPFDLPAQRGKCKTGRSVRGGVAGCFFVLILFDPLFDPLFYLFLLFPSCFSLPLSLPEPLAHPVEIVAGGRAGVVEGGAFPVENDQVGGTDAALGVREEGALGDKAGLFPRRPVRGGPIPIPFFVEDVKFIQGQTVGVGQRKADNADADSDDAVDFDRRVSLGGIGLCYGAFCCPFPFRCSFSPTWGRLSLGEAGG